MTFLTDMTIRESHTEQGGDSQSTLTIGGTNVVILERCGENEKRTREDSTKDLKNVLSLLTPVDQWYSMTPLLGLCIVKPAQIHMCVCVLEKTA